MNVSCLTYEWVMSHIWMSTVTHMNESCHTCATYVGVTWNTQSWDQPKKSCHVTRGCVMSHIWMSHVTRVNESCHTYEWVMSLTVIRSAKSAKTSSLPRFFSFRKSDLKVICMVNWVLSWLLKHSAGHAHCRSITHCNTLQHTATRCNTLQHTTTKDTGRNVQQHTATRI